MKLLVSGLLFVVVSSATFGAQAQVQTRANVVVPPKAAGAGVPKNLPVCKPRGSDPIPVVVSENFPSYAAATYSSRTGPIIIINPKYANKFTERFNMWVYLHECGHHQLGHLNPLTPKSPLASVAKRQELNADCWGIRAAKQLGHVTTTVHLNELARQMISWPEDPEHPSGADRVASLKLCLGVN